MSVVIPAFNVAEYIGRALSSIEAQSYGNVEVIVVDDGSEDGTGAIVRSRQLRFPLHYHYQENKGLGAARNTGIRASRGEFVTFLDADDMYLPRKIEAQVDNLIGRRDCGVAYCDAINFSAGKPDVFYSLKWPPLPEDEPLAGLLRLSRINPNALMLRRQWVEEGFLFLEDERSHYTEDWELTLRLAAAGCRFAYVPESLVLVEVRPGSITFGMQSQPLMKRQNLEMIREVIHTLPDSTKKSLQTERILCAHRRKLSFSYLLVGQKSQALSLSDQIFRGNFVRVVFTAVVKVVPTQILSRTARASLFVQRRVKRRRVRGELLDLCKTSLSASRV